MKIIQWIFIKLILLQVGLTIAEDSNIKQREFISGSLIDPCNDFHLYACGSWNRVFTGAVTQYNDTIEMLDYNVNKEISEILNKFSLEDKPKFVQEAYKYYKSCANLQENELNNYLKLIDKKEDFQNEWFKTLAQIRRFGLNQIFISQGYFVYAEDKREVLLSYSKPSFTPLNFDNFKIVVIYLEGVNDDIAVNKLWLEIQDFEKKLEKLQEIEDIDVKYETEYDVAIEKLSLDWLKEYIKIILNKTELEPKMKIHIKDIPYMKALEELLKKYDQQFLNRYLKLRYLSYLVFQEFFELNEINCLSNTRNLMPFAMNWLYEQQHPELLKEYQNIYEIFDNVRNNFNKTIIENKYKFNVSEVEFLLEKSNGMKLRLNNLPRSNTVATLEEYYQDLNLNIDNFYENYIKLKNFHFQKFNELLHNNEQILDDTYYVSSEEDSWPFLDTTSNILMIPLTLLQPPIYSPDLDDIYKYSTLGYLIAKEFVKGFDTEGIFRGNNGVIGTVTFTNYPLFIGSLKFLYDIDDESVNDKIAHAGGVRYAYQSFFSLYPDAVHQTQLIKDEEMSLSKVFFLNLAQAFCEPTEEPSYSEYIKYALKYFPKFAEAFNCTNKHLLYSNEDRHIW